MAQDPRVRTVSVSDIRKKFDEHVEMHQQVQASLVVPHLPKSQQNSPGAARRAVPAVGA